MNPRALGLLFYVVTFAGAATHLLGWAALDSLSRRSSLMRGAFAFSIVGFAAGTVVFIVLAPGFVGGFLFGLWIFVPYAPSAYIPVAFFHGVLFLAAARFRPRSPLLVAGGVTLLALAAAGVASWAAFPTFYGFLPDGPLISLAGLSAIPYGLLAIEFRRARAPSSTAPTAP